MEKTVQPKTGRQQASTARLAGNDRRQSRLKHPLASGMGKLAADLDGSPRVPTQLDLAGSIQASPVVQAQMRMAALINAGAKPAADVVQRNAFLTQLANAGGQIDYTAISGGAASANQRLLFLSIGDAIGKCRKRQAMLEAIENAGLAAQFIAYAAGQRWTLGSLVSTGQDIRSSHSGGAIDPQLPQAAYENPAVAGGGLTVSVAPPARNTLAEQANYAWLEDSTTFHTTDPDRPDLRGPTASGGAKPTLGSTVGGGVGANNRLPTAAGRIASYFELGAGTIHGGDGSELVSGTRVVYDPFNRRYFVSEHYDRQYEITNVPAPNAHAYYAEITADWNTLQQKKIYQAGDAAIRKILIERGLFQPLLDALSR